MVLLGRFTGFEVVGLLDDHEDVAVKPDGCGEPGSEDDLFFEVVAEDVDRSDGVEREVVR